jgi:hypothetical protein
MPDYILLLHSLRASAPPPSPERISAVTREYLDWGERQRAEGRLKAGAKLTFDGGRVLAASGEHAVVTDGPYAESKELLGGFYIVTAQDYDDACRVAESCPHLKFGGRIEVRQIDAM